MSKSEEEEEEPVTPMARLMQTPAFDYCIVAVLGFRTAIDLDLFKHQLGRTLLRHVRFTSVLVIDKGRREYFTWRQAKVDIENNVFAPRVDPDMDSPDEFVEDFASEILGIPMDTTRPLWEFHVLNVKTSEANSTVIFKMHHSMGDGVSLMSLLVACAEKTTRRPPIVSPGKQKTATSYRAGAFVKTALVKIWVAILIVFNTVVGLARALAILAFLKDTKTPVNGEGGRRGKRLVHRIVDFGDIKLVKTAMNATVNDVATGVVQAGLTRYLNKLYGQDQGHDPIYARRNNFLPPNLRLTSVVCFNMRPSSIIEDLGDIMDNEKQLRGKWGNKISGGLVPLAIALQDDPLAYVRGAKAAMDKTKLSFEPECMLMATKLLIKLLGIKAASNMLNKISLNTTLYLSNVMGPREEIAPFGHPLCYIAPNVFGFSQALFITFQSYCDKFIISVAADENSVPNPHALCDEMIKSLQDMKDCVRKRDS